MSNINFMFLEKYFLIEKPCMAKTAKSQIKLKQLAADRMPYAPTVGIYD